MNSVHLHLILVHLPIVILPVAVVILGWGIARHSLAIRTVGLVLMIFAGLLTIPAQLTGEASEEKVEHLAGVIEQSIENHDDAAELALIGGLIAAALALVSLLAGNLPIFNRLNPTAMLSALLAGAIASVLLMRAGYLGGMIRHPEAYSAVAANAAEGHQAGEATDDDD